MDASIMLVWFILARIMAIIAILTPTTGIRLKKNAIILKINTTEDPCFTSFEYSVYRVLYAFGFVFEPLPPGLRISGSSGSFGEFIHLTIQHRGYWRLC